MVISVIYNLFILTLVHLEHMYVRRNKLWFIIC